MPKSYAEAAMVKGPDHDAQPEPEDDLLAIFQHGSSTWLDNSEHGTWKKVSYVKRNKSNLNYASKNEFLSHARIPVEHIAASKKNNEHAGLYTFTFKSISMMENINQNNKNNKNNKNTMENKKNKTNKKKPDAMNVIDIKTTSNMKTKNKNDKKKNNKTGKPTRTSLTS